MQLKEKISTGTTWIKAHKGIAIIAAIVVIILISIISGGKSATSETYTVVKKDVVLDAVLSGRTKSGSQVELGFADSGRVQNVAVKEGDRVRRGQLLASLELSDLYAELQDAQSSVVIAESQASSGNVNLDKITSEQDTLVANAKKTMLTEGLEAIAEDSSTTATAPIITGEYTGIEGRYTIRVYLSGAQSGYSFEVSGLENNFISELTTSQSVPLGTKGLYIRFPQTAGYGNTRWTVDIPNKRSSSYTANYNAYLAAVSTRDRVITEATNDVSAATGVDSVLQAKIEQARAQVQSIQSKIAKRLITAPFDGIVATIAIEKGETSSSASTIKLISDTDYEVVAKVPELDIAKLAVGARAAIALDAYPGETFPGMVVSINPAETIIDGVPVYEAKIVFDPLDPRVRSGMTATVSITTASQPDVIAIPSRFVQMTNGETLVYMQTDAEPLKQPVVLGLKGSDGYVEIVEGLALGQVIVAPPAK